MRLREPPEVARVQVPPELAEGPRINRWAAPETIAAVAACPLGDRDRAGLVRLMLVSAWASHLAGTRRWIANQHLDPVIARQLLGPRREPYLDRPGTPAPERAGYAEVASPS